MSIVLSSVLISAVTAAVVSGILNLYGEWRERKARQRELLFTFAIDLSKADWLGANLCAVHLQASQ
jgi:hypothetical protein